MIKHIQGNVVDVKADAIAHQANCFHIMGGGVAAAIRAKYPEAYQADLKTPRGSKAKLGTFSYAKTKDKKIIFNVYSQFGLSAGINDRATLYDMVDKGLRAVEHKIAGSMTQLDEPFILAIPYKYGCALGGGSWPVVNAIIEDIFKNSPIKLLICEYNPPVIPSHREVLLDDDQISLLG